MASLRISGVAAATGFSTSTLRYYEEIGLLPEVDRTDGDYRVFDDRVLQRLRLIARAKDQGLSLEEIGEVATIWDRDDCAPVQARLVALAREKSRDARARSLELRTFADELDSTLEELGRHTASGACDDDCGCTTTAGTAPGPASVPFGRTPSPPSREPIVCTLAPDVLRDRLDDWRDALHDAEDAESGRGAATIRFGAGVDVSRLATLKADEQRCCSFLGFGLRIDARGVTLEIRGHADAQPLLDGFVELARSDDSSSRLAPPRPAAAT